LFKKKNMSRYLEDEQFISIDRLILDSEGGKPSIDPPVGLLKGKHYRFAHSLRPEHEAAIEALCGLNISRLGINYETRPIGMGYTKHYRTDKGIGVYYNRELNGIMPQIIDALKQLDTSQPDASEV
jgi:hypothetical protein